MAARLWWVGVVLVLASCHSSGHVGSAKKTTPSIAPLPEATAITEAPNPSFGTDPVWGTAARQCVDADRLLATGAGYLLGSQRARILDVRSGEIVAGNFTGLSPLNEDGTAKVYWGAVGAPNLPHTAALTVTLTRLDRPSVAASVQRFPAGFARTSDTGPYFWATGTLFGSLGRWRVVAEAPGHWGCFIVSVTAHRGCWSSDPGPCITPARLEH